MVLKMHFMLKGYFTNIAFNLTLLWEFREIRLSEILCESSWSVEPICALADCELFIPEADKVYF
jgi:hypothetical protein